MKYRLLTSLTSVALAIAASTASAQKPLDGLKGTPWEGAALHAGVDPLLMFAVALYESRQHAGRGAIAPHPYAMNSSATGSHFPATKQAAEAVLAEELRKTQRIDVCPMQISIRWNGHRVARPADLLNLPTCLAVGASLLSEALASAPGDLELGVGRYHTWNVAREGDAREYGRNVIRIWQNLIRES